MEEVIVCMHVCMWDMFPLSPLLPPIFFLTPPEVVLSFSRVVFVGTFSESELGRMGLGFSAFDFFFGVGVEVGVGCEIWFDMDAMVRVEKEIAKRAVVLFPSFLFLVLLLPLLFFSLSLVPSLLLVSDEERGRESVEVISNVFVSRLQA